jgi:hypothetical protein
VGIQANKNKRKGYINSSNAELNPICHLLALLGAHHILHVSRIRVKFPSSVKTYEPAARFCNSGRHLMCVQTGVDENR